MKLKLENIFSNTGKFIDGNPATGTQGTIVTAKWLNDVQERTQDVFEELKNVLALGNLQPNPQSQRQVADAIRAYIASLQASTTQKGIVQLSHETSGTDRSKAASEYALGEVRRLANQAQVSVNGISLTWNNVQQKPATFPPSAHTHPISEITGLQAALNGKAASSHTHSWAQITGKPTTVQGAGLTNAMRDDADNTITGIISINRADSFIKGTHNNQNSWYVGSGSASNNDVQLHSWLHGTTFTLKNDRLLANKALYVNDHQVYHTGNLPRANLTGAGISQLSSEIDSNDETKAATPKAVKTAYDKAVDAEKKALPLGAVIAFPKEITHPTGFLKCNGTTFNQQTYPDLYRALGNKNKLPDLGRSDVGQLAYFPTDTIPDGWLACDGKTISQTTYPELYRYLGNQYGAHGKLPNAEDRFIRNAGAGLRVGQVQADEFKAHHHRQPLGYPAGSRELSVIDEQWETTGQIDQNMPIVLSKDSNPGDNRWAYSKFNHDKEGGTETRPKSIVFKLCIKAKNSFDDVQFWIKAFGEVQNVGAMDASRLGQEIQALRADKADRNHSHTAAQISDFAQSVAEQFSYQKIGDHEVWKFPDGTMHQVLRFHSATGFTTNWQLRHQLVFPVAFRQTPKCFASLASEQGTFTNGREDNNKNYHQAVTLNSFLKFNYGDSSGAKLLFWAYNPDGDGNREPETWHILAIGRWK